MPWCESARAGLRWSRNPLSRGGPVMSEPKTVAVAITEVVPGLFHYRIDDERIKSQSDAYAVARDGRVVLIDPLPLEPSVLMRLGRIEAIVLGAPGHQR